VVSVTADTNIYVSALNFGGGPDRVLDLARAGTIRLAISEAILGRAGRRFAVEVRME
jgi:predicted nucleic acid-binding protein